MSTLGFRYFVTFIDDFSSCTWLFLMKSPIELFIVFQKFFADSSIFHTSIHIIRSDNALEYLSAPFFAFYPPMGFFISLLVLTFHNKIGWLSARIVT